MKYMYIKIKVTVYTRLHSITVHRTRIEILKDKLFDKKKLLSSDFHPGLFKFLVCRNAALEKHTWR